MNAHETFASWGVDVEEGNQSLPSRRWGTLKFMTGSPSGFSWFDYMAHPLGEGIALPEELDRRVWAWGREGDARMYRDEGSLAWNEWMVDWMKRGRALASEVSEVLNCPVDYEYEMSGTIERIEPPTKRFVRRQHRSHKD